MIASTYPTSKDGYDWLGVVGQGSQSAVHKVRVRSGQLQGKVLAMKEINLDRLADSRIKSIMKQTVAFSDISHPSLCDYIVSFTEDQAAFFGFEFMACGSLAGLVRRKFPEGIKDISLIATVLKAILEGIEYLHSNKMFHRDIKASNILVSAEGRVALADFSLSAKLKKGRKNETVTGSPCWMAPEILEGDKGYDNSVDIWSLGITTIELVEGKAPYAEVNSMQAMLHIINDDPPQLSQEPWNQLLVAFTNDCLQKNPQQRPSAADLLKTHKTLWSKARDQKYVASALQLATNQILVERPSWPGQASELSTAETLAGKSQGHIAWNFDLDDRD